jgi:hypothetical protein
MRSGLFASEINFLQQNYKKEGGAVKKIDYFLLTGRFLGGGDEINVKWEKSGDGKWRRENQKGRWKEMGSRTGN